MQATMRPIYYLSLGDSIAAGVGASWRRGFPSHYRDMTERYLRRPVLLKNFGKRGITTYELLNILQKPQVIKAIFLADMITISTGGNDIIKTFKQYARTGNEQLFEQNFRMFHDQCNEMMRIILEIKSRSNKPFMIRWIDCYNPFPENPIAVKWISAYNDVIHNYDHFSQIRVAPVYHAFRKKEKELLCSDRVHPNSFGHYLIARTIFYTGLNSLDD